MMGAKKQKMTFEEALQKLEELVSKLEDTNAPLDESICYFEEAMKLSSLCSSKLNEAERKISILMADSANKQLETNFEMEGIDEVE